MTVADVAVTFAETAPALHARGWRPIPLVADSKVPAEAGWHRRNQTPWSPAELGQVVSYFGNDAACGLAIAPETLAIDADILDTGRAEEVAALADRHLGRTPLVRIGMAPKWVRFYRARGRLRSSKPHPLELFCGSGQIAAFGWHRQAGRPYLWYGASPLSLAVDAADIPAVTDRQLQQFLRAAQPLLREMRRAAQRRHGGKGAGVGVDAGDHLRDLLGRGFAFEHAARRVLEGAVEGGRHHAVSSVVSYGYNRGMDADAIYTLVFDAAPPQLWEHVNTDGYFERVLRDFQPIQDAWRIRL
jgi:hypothetical protein